MLWSMVTLLGLGMAFLHFSNTVQSAGRDGVSYVNSPLIRKELNSHYSVLAEAVQDFAIGDMIHKISNIAFCAKCQ